jgi:hypothetical protein
MGRALSGVFAGMCGCVSEDELQCLVPQMRNVVLYVRLYVENHYRG